jgi:endogenous inhibitor of DNA gyrase (YacG/DUF329 family)
MPHYDMRCPVCKKEVAPASAYVPFCSGRCRLIDLGNWATEQYRIPAEDDPDPEEQEEEKDREP